MLKKIAQLDPEPPWSILTAVGVLLAMFAALLIGTTLAATLLDDSPQALMTGWSIGMILTILFVMVSRRRTPEEATALKIDAPVRVLILLIFGLGMAITLDLISAIVVGQFELASAELIRFSAAEVGLSGWLIALIFMAALQPIAEELVFRGVMFPALRSALGAWLGLIVCAGFHASFHFLAYPPSPENQTVLTWYGLILPFLDALVFSGVRAYTGSTRAAIIVHAAFGLFAVIKVITFS